MKFDHVLAALILTASASAQAPTITSFDPQGLHAFDTGPVTVVGTNLDTISIVKLGGVAQSITSQSSTQLIFDKAANLPGMLSLSVEGPNGTADAAVGFASTPAISAATGTIGGTLQVTVRNGAPGLYALALGAGVLGSPIPVPPIYYGLVLHPGLPLATIASGLLATPTPLLTSFAVPNDASLVSASLYLQAWAQQNLGPTATSSFTNPVSLAFSLPGNQWYTKQPLVVARRALAAVAIDGIVYAVGGSDTGGSSAVTTLDAYNPITNQWQSKQPMNAARFYLAAAELDGLLYAIGGSAAGQDVATVEAYDPASNAWTSRASMPSARSNLAAVALNGRIYAIGGDPGLGVVEAYDPVSNAWSAKASLTFPRFALAAVAFGGRIYAIGGNLGAEKVEEYDPTTNQWTTKMAMTTPRFGAGAALANGKIYVIGGGGGELDVVEAFDPVRNMWSTWKHMTTPRRELACAFAGGYIYAIGGATGTANNVLSTVELYAP